MVTITFYEQESKFLQAIQAAERLGHKVDAQVRKYTWEKYDYR